MKRISEIIKTMYPEVKCVTDECENMTYMVVCDDCVENLLPSYENRLERDREDRR